jgi:hypothetical protein
MLACTRISRTSIAERRNETPPVLIKLSFVMWGADWSV